MTTTRTALLLSLLAACSDSGEGDPPCGPGTMEENGVCVPAMAEDDDASTGPPVTTSPTGSDDDDVSDSHASAEGTSSDGPSSTTYASCFAGSDVECSENEYCMETLDTCAALCSYDTDCPAPPGGTAVQRCEDIEGYWSEICVLYCGVEGSTCPTGMVCRDTTLCDAGDGGSTGDEDTYGCNASSLPICVWE